MWSLIFLLQTREVKSLIPIVKCPKCGNEEQIDHVLTAQSNQDVIYTCPGCLLEVRNIHTSKG